MPKKPRRSEVPRILAAFGGLFVVVSLIGWQRTDPTLLRPGPGRVSNPCGVVGANVADVLLHLVGWGAIATLLLIALPILSMAGRSVGTRRQWALGSWLFVMLLAVTELAVGRNPDAFPSPGGFVGSFVAFHLASFAGVVGAWIALLASVVGTLSVLRQVSLGEAAKRGFQHWDRARPVLHARIADAAARLREAAVEAGRRFARACAAQFARASADGADRFRNIGSGTRGAFGRMAAAFTRRSDDALDPFVIDTSGEEAPLESMTEAVAPTRFEAQSSVAVTQHHSALGLLDDAVDDILSLFPDFGSRGTGAAVPADRTLLSDEPAPVDAGRTHASTQVASVPTATVGSSPTRVSDAGDRTQVAGADVTMVAPVVAPDGATLPAVEPTQAAVPNRPPVAHRPPTVQKVEGLDDVIADDGRAVAASASRAYSLPALDLLDSVPSRNLEVDSDLLQGLAARLEDALASFRVTGEVRQVHVGPVVTTLEFLPTAGIKVSRVQGLQDDLAMNLKAMSVRVVAPIPGRGVVGIEIPSEQRLTIYLREVLASDEFRKSNAALPVAIGKDVNNRPVVEDLSKMPHLLVGGTTGSGKSVGVNGMLMSLLFTKTPGELRLLLIDPKRLEFAAYNDIPHLLHPVVTEPKGAAAALAWACLEMDRRYQTMQEWDVKSLATYNRKVERVRKNWDRDAMRRFGPKDWDGKDPLPLPETMPHIVIVIDELADLMMVAKKEVEDSIVRLAQMARAAGMHLVIATQRPSAAVVTGLIKSNMPTRIAFKLRQSLDSRIILDQGGAEKLLGMGDMLLLPQAGDVRRCHGAFVSEDEVLAVTDFVRSQAEPDYVAGITAEPGEGLDGPLFEEDFDPLYDDAVNIVIQQGKASTSMIQRFLKIGYNRAARIVDCMESQGVVGPADGARPREVLVGQDPA